MIISNLKAVKRDWQKATNSVDTRARRTRDEMMTALIQLSKEEIQGKRGSHKGPNGGRVWDKATAGQPPMNRTGDLRRSITGKKYKAGFGTYSAIVGPTIIYGRSVEVGGQYAPPSWRGTSATRGFPYMEPAYKKFRTQVFQQIVRKNFGRG